MGPGRPLRQVITLTPPSLSHVGMKKKRIQSVEGFIKEHFNGDPHAFKRHYGLVMQKIERWIEKHALICENAVYLRKSRFNDNMDEIFTSVPALHEPKSVILAPLLEDFIQYECEGNMTLFAADHNTTQQQVHRWTKKATCLWAFAEVYRLQEELKPVH